jgi:hypothetical protein
MATPKDLTGAVVELSAKVDGRVVAVLMQVVEEIRDPAARGLQRVAVFAAGSEWKGDATAPLEIMFVVCFAVKLHLRRRLARVVGHAPVPRLSRELGFRELWNTAVLGTAVERGWKAGDDYDRLFD